MNTETALTTTNAAPPAQLSAFQSIESFEAVQRMAKLLCASSIVPQSYRENLGDAVIALEMANRIGANPLAVMQNLYIVHGKPAWSSQFLIACSNASGKFATPIRYLFSGEGDEYGCQAWAIDKSGEKLMGTKVTIGMAKVEGWTAKNGSKWKSMPDQMLTYRAATFFVRAYAPELTMGIQTDSEIIDIAPVVTDPVKKAKPVYQFKDADKKPDDVRNTPDISGPPMDVAGEVPPPIPPEVSATLPAAAPDEQLTPIQKAMQEIRGSTFVDFVEFAQGQFPQSDFSQIENMGEFLPLVISELSKPAKLKALKVWLRSAVEQRSVKA